MGWGWWTSNRRAPCEPLEIGSPFSKILSQPSNQIRRSNSLEHSSPIDPKHPELHAVKGLYQERTEMWEKAREAFKKDIISLKEKLEEEFRSLIGVEHWLPTTGSNVTPMRPSWPFCPCSRPNTIQFSWDTTDIYLIPMFEILPFNFFFGDCILGIRNPHFGWIV